MRRKIVAGNWKMNKDYFSSESFVSKLINLYKSTDTEVIIEAYRSYGPDAVKRFNGMFAFAIYDTQEKKLFMARDRMDEAPDMQRALRDKRSLSDVAMEELK